VTGRFIGLIGGGFLLLKRAPHASAT
jgi:hypothetical protein